MSGCRFIQTLPGSISKVIVYCVSSINGKRFKMFFQIEPKYNMIMKFCFRFLLIMLFICFLKHLNSFPFSLYLVSKNNRFSMTSNQNRKLKACNDHQSNIVYTYFFLIIIFYINCKYSYWDDICYNTIRKCAS